MESTSLQPPPTRSLPPGVRLSRSGGFFSRLEAFCFRPGHFECPANRRRGIYPGIPRFFRLTSLLADLQSAWQNSPYYFAIGLLSSHLLGSGITPFAGPCSDLHPGKAVLGLKVVRGNGRKSLSAGPCCVFRLLDFLGRLAFPGVSVGIVGPKPAGLAR